MASILAISTRLSQFKQRRVRAVEVQSAESAQSLESRGQDEVEGFIGEAASRIGGKMFAPPELTCNAPRSSAVEDSFLERSEKFDSCYLADLKDKELAEEELAKVMQAEGWQAQFVQVEPGKQNCNDKRTNPTALQIRGCRCT